MNVALLQILHLSLGFCIGPVRTKVFHMRKEFKKCIHAAQFFTLLGLATGVFTLFLLALLGEFASRQTFYCWLIHLLPITALVHE
ncbi:hypothetical protein Gasu2_14620 [Galdieria sulphuraria]|nr:hypothetical protein Gasu2_14620 [Galdieria sulphuraria]